MARQFRALRYGIVETDIDWHLDGNNIDALKMTVNKNITLTAVIVYGLKNDIPNSQYWYDRHKRENTIIIRHSSGTYVQPYEISATKQEIQIIRLSDPITIIGDIGFTVMIPSPKLLVHYGSQCQKDWEKNDIKVRFEYTSECTTDTNEEQGQIAGIEFSV